MNSAPENTALGVGSPTPSVPPEPPLKESSSRTRPQPHTVPSVLRARSISLPPAAIWATPSITRMGVRLLVVAPSPRELTSGTVPQAHSPPSAPTAKPQLRPAVTRAIPVSPETCTGWVRLTVVPSPS